MEDKLLNEFQSFCKFNWKYRGKDEIDVEIDIEYEKYCSECNEENIISDFQYERISPCDYYQIEEFVREISDRI